jgi:hypothetical protein
VPYPTAVRAQWLHRITSKFDAGCTARDQARAHNIGDGALAEEVTGRFRVGALRGHGNHLQLTEYKMTNEPVPFV